jgi:hypothetical protein
MRRSKPSKSYWEMNVDELAEATREFDRPTSPSRLRPLSKRERERFERAQRSPYVSVFVGDGNRLVTVAIDDALLRQSDEYARKHKLSRSELIALGLQKLLVKAG